MLWDLSTRKLFLQSESVLKLGRNDSDVTTIILIKCLRALLKFIAIIFARPLILSNLGEFSKSWQTRQHPIVQEKMNYVIVCFRCPLKKPRAQNVVFVTQRNVSESVMHVHSCYFAYKLIAFLTFLLSMARAISNRSRSSEWTLRD